MIPAGIDQGLGSGLRLRSIGPGDSAQLAGLVSQLSVESRRRRFLSTGLSETNAWVARLLAADDSDHLAECLLARDEFGEVMVGVVELIRDDVEGDLGEFAATISDEWQGLGVGSILTRRLAERSLNIGILRWRAYRMAENDLVARLLDGIGETEESEVDYGIVTSTHRLRQTL